MLKLYPLLSTLPFSLSDGASFMKRNFTRRTNGHNLGTPRTLHFCPSSRTKCFVSHYIHGLLFVFFFISRDIKLVSAHIKVRFLYKTHKNFS